MPSQKQMLDHHQQQRVLSKTNEIQEYTTRILVLAEHNAKNTQKNQPLSRQSLHAQADRRHGFLLCTKLLH